jgi:hypothetical protein
MKFKALLLITLGYLSIPSLNAQTYCPSKGNLPWNEWIANVKIGTIDNASQKEGYGNFYEPNHRPCQRRNLPPQYHAGF